MDGEIHDNSSSFPLPVMYFGPTFLVFGKVGVLVTSLLIVGFGRLGAMGRTLQGPFDVLGRCKKC